MFYRYEIKKDGQEDILYLYATMTYEFSKELSSTNNNKVKDKCNEFIKNNSINFKGNKIYLVINGIIVKTIDIKKKEKIINMTTKVDYSNDNYFVNVHFKDNHISKMSLKDYLLGILATNALQNLELTTLKSLTLLYRTYAYMQMNKRNYIEAINEFQIYKPISYYKIIWLDKYQDYYNKINKAIEETDNEFLTYNNEFIYPFIHICSNGYTSKKENYPYLEKVNSLWDLAYKDYINIKNYSYEEIEDLLKIDKDSLKDIEIIENDENNNIKKIRIGNNTYNGNIFKSLLNLKSTDITIIIHPTYIKFITRGEGHNLGISEFAANEIAKTNCSYLSILKYYFPNVKINKYVISI